MKTFFKFLLPILLLCFVFFILKNKKTEDAPIFVNNPNFNLSEIVEGVFVHYGKHVLFDDKDRGDIANLGVIIGDKCVAAIDTSGSIKTAKLFKIEIEKITEKPVCYVINTHVHFDHVLGNVIFKSDKTEFVGHVNLFEAMPANKDFFLTEFAEDLGDYANEESIIPPTILVEDSMQLDLGNRTLTLKAYSNAHSSTDLIVIDDNTKTVFLGDLLFVDRIPALDGSLKGWLSVLEELSQEEFTNVIPGHGAMVDWPQGAEDEKNYLNLLLSEIRQKLEEGAFMEDIVGEVGKEEKLKWLLHEQHHKRNVTKAFSELEWE